MAITQQTADSRQQTAIGNGLTLIEVLIVLAVFSVISVVSVQIFYSSLRATNKAKVIGEVGQNGQLVANIVAQRIRGARSVTVTDCSGTPQCLTMILASSDGTTSTVQCVPVAGSSNGRVTVGPQPLSNTDPVAGVDFSECWFSLESGPNVDLITIHFLLQQGVNAPTRQDWKANVTIEKTVSLRNQ